MDKDTYQIDDRIFNVKFACDLKMCKGACCTVKGTLGAPTSESEVKVIHENLEFVNKYLSRDKLKTIENEGVYVEYDGKLWLNTVDDNECIFSFEQNGIAYCSFHRAYINDEINFRKPISCDLFPIRADRDGTVILRYEQFFECEPALENGRILNKTIFEYVQDALIRSFGIKFYHKYSNFINKDF